MYPFCYVDVTGKPAGRLNDIMRFMAKDLGWELIQEGVPPKRVVAGLVEGGHDVALTINSYPGYGEGAHYSPAPVDYMELRAYSLGNDPGVSRKEDLAGRRVAVLHGYGYGGVRQFLDDPANNATIANEVLTPEQGLKVLEAGRSDLFLDYAPSMQRVLKDSPNEAVRSSLIFKAPVYINTSRKTDPDGAKLAKLWQVYTSRWGDAAGFDAAYQEAYPPPAWD